MDKYQKYILNISKIGSFCDCRYVEDEEVGSWKDYGNFDNENDTFNVSQDEDINKTQYVLTINRTPIGYTLFENVLVYQKGRWAEVPCVNEQYRIVIDFNDKIEKIKFSFINGIADDYILKVTYTEADKEQYYAKLEQARKDGLLATAEIKVSTGADLVNIYFQPCCDEYDHTEIKLFVPKDNATVGVSHGPIQKPSSWSVIKKCDVPVDDFYKSINGLAYGKYAFILKQFDKNNQPLLETDYIEFSIKKPVRPEIGYANVI